MKNFKHLIEIPDSLSLDILFLLGFRPNIITGFSSSTHFNIDKKCIENVIFLTKKRLRESENISYLFNVQSTLSEVFINLNYISENQVHYYDEFIN